MKPSSKSVHSVAELSHQHRILCALRSEWPLVLKKLKQIYFIVVHMNKHHIFDMKYLYPKLRGIDPHYHEYIFCLHELLSEYPYLYNHNEFLFGDVDLMVNGIAGLGIMNSQLSFSLGFTNPETCIGLEFIIKFELDPDNKVAGKLRGFDINIKTHGSPTADGNITLTNFIRHHHLSAERNFGYIEQSKSLEDNITSFLSSASNILEGPMKDIVNGTNWSPIPIDWRGYK